MENLFKINEREWRIISISKWRSINGVYKCSDISVGHVPVGSVGETPVGYRESDYKLDKYLGIEGYSDEQNDAIFNGKWEDVQKAIARRILKIEGWKTANLETEGSLMKSVRIVDAVSTS